MSKSVGHTAGTRGGPCATRLFGLAQQTKSNSVLSNISLSIPLPILISGSEIQISQIMEENDVNIMIIIRLSVVVCCSDLDQNIHDLFGFL